MCSMTQFGDILMCDLDLWSSVLRVNVLVSGNSKAVIFCVTDTSIHKLTLILMMTDI